jgi:hypothetical protein
MKPISMFTLVTLVVGLLVSVGRASTEGDNSDYLNRVKCNAAIQEAKDAVAKQNERDTNPFCQGIFKPSTRLQECKDAKTAYETAVSKKPTGPLLKKALQCNAEDEAAGEEAVLTEPDDPEGVTAASQDGCAQFMSVSCKARNGGKKSDAKSDKESAQERVDKSQETVDSVQEELTKATKEYKQEQTEISNSVQKATQKLQDDNQDLNNSLEDGLAKAGEDLQKVKEEVDKAEGEFDNKYLQMRAQYRQADTENIMAIDSVEGECRKQAEGERSKIEAKVQAILDNEYKKPRVHDLQSLAGSNTRVTDKAEAKIKLSYDQTYARCMQTSQKKLQAIELNKKNQLKLLEDQAALIENNRAKLYAQLIQRSQASDQEKQRLQTRVQQAAQRLQQNYQSLIAQKQQEAKTSSENYQTDMQTKQNKLTTQYQKLMTSQMEAATAGTRYNCAEKYGMGESEADKAMDKYSTAPENELKYESACEEYKPCLGDKASADMCKPLGTAGTTTEDLRAGTESRRAKK